MLLGCTVPFDGPSKFTISYFEIRGYTDTIGVQGGAGGGQIVFRVGNISNVKLLDFLCYTIFDPRPPILVHAVQFSQSKVALQHNFKKFLNL